MTSPIGEAHQIAGTWTAAILLYRIQYWIKKTKITRGGYKWIALSREEWMEELDMTLNEYNAALSRLKKLGVIVVETHLLGGRTRAFIRLPEYPPSNEKDEKGGMNIATTDNMSIQTTIAVGENTQSRNMNIKTSEGNIKNQISTNMNNHISYIDNNNYLYKSELNKREINKVSSGSSPASGFFPEQNLAPEGEKIEKIKPQNTRKIKHENLENPPEQKLENSQKPKEGKMKVADVLQNLKGSKHNHRKDSVPQLTSLWKNLVSELFDVEFIHLTKQQCGMFKHFRDKCPKGEAAKILEWVLNNWIKFVKEVESRMGIKNTPAYPKVDFLLKHTDIAVDLHKKARNWKKELASTQLSDKLDNNLQLIATKSPQKPPSPRRRSDQQPKSYSDLMSIIGSGSEK